MKGKKLVYYLVAEVHSAFGQGENHYQVVRCGEYLKDNDYDRLSPDVVSPGPIQVAASTRDEALVEYGHWLEWAKSRAKEKENGDVV
jgi:hypothetical protein